MRDSTPTQYYLFRQTAEGFNDLPLPCTEPAHGRAVSKLSPVVLIFLIYLISRDFGVEGVSAHFLPERGTGEIVMVKENIYFVLLANASPNFQLFSYCTAGSGRDKVPLRYSIVPIS